MRRSTTGMLATSALLGVALLAPTPALAVDGEFAAEANGSQLFVDAVNLGALTAEPPVGSVAQIGVAPTLGEVDTAGLGDGVLSHAFGQNLDVSLLDQQLPLDQLSTAEQTAPPDNADPTVSQLIPLDAASPLLTGSVLESTAWARTPSAVECPDQDGRSVVSEGTSTTTDLGVLEIAEGTSLISVTGADDGTLRSASGTYVGPDGEVIAESRAQTAEVNVAGELDIQVVSPTLTAIATGTPGGASVEYTGQVLLNGEELVGTASQTIALTVLEPLLAPLDELLLNEVFGPLDEVLTQVLGPVGEALGDLPPPLGDILNYEDLTPTLLTDLIQTEDLSLEDLAGFLSPTVNISVAELQSSTSEDGTSASGQISVVRIGLTLLNTLLDTEDELLVVDLMPLSVEANAPAGGLDCGAGDNPLDEVHKDVTAAKVRPGTTFDYAITVPNRDPSCTLTDVTVTDVVEGPGTIESTTPSGQVDGNTATWTIDSLAPNESRTFIVTVRVDDDAQNGESFDDRVTVTGDCDGQPVEGGDTIDDIPVVTTESLDGCDVSASNKSATHLEVAPGQSFSYLIHAYNAGDEDCGETIVTDTLPDGVTFVSCAPACEDAGQEVVFTLDELAAGQAVDLTITVTAPDEPTSDITNVAVIAPSNGSSTEVTTGIPDVTDRSVPAPPNPADFTGVAGGTAPDEQLPRTGGGAAVLALGALAAAGALRRRF